MIVTKSEDNRLEFDNGLVVIGDGESDCCAYNYLDFEQLPIGTELPTMNASQFKKAITVKEDGFIVKDVEGTPKWVQARSDQNGYYSNMTTLITVYKGRSSTIKDLYGELSDY